jgi:SPP1 gp7 family putative phage head morphogenesis protein
MAQKKPRAKSKAAPAKPRKPSANPARFEEAVGFFRTKVPIRKKDWEKLSDDARRRAFTAAGVANLDVMAQVQRELLKAIAKGKSLEQFKREVKAKLESQWGGPIGGRIENIFRTNAQAAYAAGRRRQLARPEVLKHRPFWKFSAVLDPRTSDICRPLNGTVLPAGHAFWSSHTPPLHFQCRSAILSLSKTEAKQAGVSRRAPKSQPQEGFGSADPLDWRPVLTGYPKELVKIFRRGQ